MLARVEGKLSRLPLSSDFGRGDFVQTLLASAGPGVHVTMHDTATVIVQLTMENSLLQDFKSRQESL
jgi:hypothetical protein